MQQQQPFAIRTLALAAAGLAAWPAPAASAGRASSPAGPESLPVLFSADDPANDATGTGRYTLPADGSLRDGDFDLRRFTVRLDGDQAVLEIALGSAVRAPASAHRTNQVPLTLSNNIYLQNIDVYADRARDGSGHARAMPGRRVAFPPGQTWQRAVVLTPQPEALRGLLASALGEAAPDVLVPRVEAKGRVLVARVPVAALGGVPDPSWAWSVHLSGARWEHTFDGFDRLRGTHEPDAFTMPVLSIAEPYAFGGAPVGRSHPQVLDVLLPAGVDQGRVLSAFGATDFAQVPFVTADSAGMRLAPAPVKIAQAAPSKEPGMGMPGSGTAAQSGTISMPVVPFPGIPMPGSSVPPAAPVPPGLVVADAAGDMVSVSGPADGVKPFQIGTVTDGSGRVLGRLVVVRVLDGGLVANVVEQREKITAGARVRFEAPVQAHTEAP